MPVGRKKGCKKSGGRQAGSQNKITISVKESVLNSFNQLQATDRYNLFAWAKENTTEFYKIAAKLIPTEVDATVREIIVNTPE